MGIIGMSIPCIALCLIFIGADGFRTTAAAVPYFPQELAGTKMAPEDQRNFVHVASFIQNSDVMGLETKVPGLNVLNAVRNYQQSKVGEYCRTLLRMWTKFGKDDRLKNKNEVFRNIDSLKIPEGFKNAIKGLFDHVQKLQDLVIAGSTTQPTTVAPTTVHVPDSTTQTTNFPSFEEFQADASANPIKN